MVKVPEPPSVRDWKDLVEISDKFQSSAETYVFRGQRDADWALKTSLERALADFGIPQKDAEKTEVGLVCRFRRQGHQHIRVATPKDNQVIEWLALMQHFGAPTRLQDWTYSFFVAIFFAIETADRPSAVWVLNRDKLLSSLAELAKAAGLNDSFVATPLRDGYKDDDDSFTELFARTPPIKLVCPVNPYRLNERLSIQQGLFLSPGDITSSFQANLDASLYSNGQSVTKLILPDTDAFRSEALSRLHGLNINASTLFPGLDGFARSLRTMLACKSIIPSTKSWSVEFQK